MQGPQQDLQSSLKSKAPVVSLSGSRIANCPLTRAGFKAVEVLLSGLEEEFTVRATVNFQGCQHIKQSSRGLLNKQVVQHVDTTGGCSFFSQQGFAAGMVCPGLSRSHCLPLLPLVCW